jgi:hypothetical protein
VTGQPWRDRAIVHPRPEVTLAELEARFPRWTISLPGMGRWWAIDKDSPSLEQQKAGCVITVEADSADELWDALLIQERLRGRR